MITLENTQTPAGILGGANPVELVCDRCGNPFSLQFPRLAQWVKTCPDCIEIQVREEFRQDAAKAGQRGAIDVSGWHRLCPDEFRELDFARLPNPTKTEQAMGWKFGPHGLVLHGETGRGKTRTLYLLLRREFEAGRTIAVCDHTSGLRYAEAYSEGPEHARLWFEHRCKVDILALDDVFKVKLTDSFEQALFQIVSHRTERKKPVLITTNDVGATLAARMSPDRGPAFVRRLRDYCKAISF